MGYKGRYLAESMFWAKRLSAEIDRRRMQEVRTRLACNPSGDGAPIRSEKEVICKRESCDTAPFFLYAARLKRIEK